jgi:translation initiation factor 2B subunit (eIF-2B alpha/beta/delta family)
MPEGGPLPRPWLLRALDLETDRASGSGELSLAALRAFRGAAAELAADENPAAAAQLHAYAEQLRRSAARAADLPGYLAAAEAKVPDGPAAVAAEIDRILAGAEGGADALIEAAALVVRPGARVLTHGFGELVLQILTRLGDRIERLTVCEARPLNQGVRLAAAIAEHAVPVRLVTEGQLELVVPECDLALVEVERVLPSGDVAAPIGTAVVARLCAAHQVPVYAVAPRTRWVTGDHAHAVFRPERRPPSEVLPTPAPGVEVVNVASDLTPRALIAGYLTERGREDPHVEAHG